MQGATPQDVIEGRARWCVVCGERDTVLASLADASIDVTITDPPYNERTHAGAKVKGGKLIADSTVNFAVLDGFAWWSDALRITKRWCLAFCAAEQLGGYEMASKLPPLLGIRGFARECGFASVRLLSSQAIVRVLAPMPSPSRTEKVASDGTAAAQSQCGRMGTRPTRSARRAFIPRRNRFVSCVNSCASSRTPTR